MDLLCTENILNDYENDHQQQQQQQQQLQLQSSKPLLIPNAPSPCSNSLSNSSLSSGYGSIKSNSSTGDSCTTCTTSALSSCSHKTKLAAECSNAAGAQSLFLQQSIASSSYQQQQQQKQQQQISTTVYINNYLNRTLEYVNTATEDPTFLTDRCLENALKAEEKRPQPICTYFRTVQKDITPPMRKIVAEWMMEVCAEEKCQEEVVLLALNYMDRFLSTKSVRKTHLQILAAACLLLASKLREPSCRALSAELLVFYTDNSIFKNDLIKWELYVLSRLGWDLASVTPLDFLELLLIRLPIRSNKCPDLNIDKVRQHAQAFISLAAKEHYFSVYSASTIAASSIAASMSGLNWHLRTGQNLRYLLNLLTDLTSIEQDYLQDCMLKMESVFAEHSRNLQPYLSQHLQHQQQQQQQQQQQPPQPHQSQHQLQHQHQVYNSHDRHGNPNANALLPDLTQTCKMQANAQKDVQDIKF